MRMGAAPPACRLCQHQLCSDHASHHPSPPSQFDPACNTIAAPTMFSTVFVCFSLLRGMPSGVQGWPWCNVHCHQVVAHQEKHWQRRLRQHSYVASSCPPEQVYRMPRMSTTRPVRGNTRQRHKQCSTFVGVQQHNITCTSCTYQVMYAVSEVPRKCSDNWISVCMCENFQHSLRMQLYW